MIAINLLSYFTESNDYKNIIIIVVEAVIGIIFIGLIIFELYLLKSMFSMLKTNLHYYYRNKKKHFILISLLNITTFANRILLNNYFSLNINFNKIIGLEKDDSGSLWIKIMWIIFVLTYHWAIYTYAYLHSQNIDYKLYLFDLLKGMKVSCRYNDWSIIIRKSSFYRSQSLIVIPDCSEPDNHSSCTHSECQNISLRSLLQNGSNDNQY